MHMVKTLSKLFLGLYLVFVGLVGVGVNLSFVTPGVLGFLALVAGVLFIVRGVKCWGHCDHCCHTDKDVNPKY